MGIQVQPNCCGRWIVISRKGYMYDLNIGSGVLSNPRYMGADVDGTTGTPVNSNKALACIARHPLSGKMYSHQQAYGDAATPGAVSNLYELKLDGTATLIGPLRSPSNIPPDNSWDTGIAFGGNAFGPNGIQLYGVGWNGHAVRNLMLTTISTATGSATPYADNVDGSGPQTAGVGHVTSNVYGMAYRLTDGKMYAFGSLAENTTNGGPNFQVNWYLGEVNLTTGRWENRRPSITHVSKFLVDMKFDGDNLLVGITANNNPRVARIKDLVSGAVEIGATITGLQPGDTALTGIAKVG